MRVANKLYRTIWVGKNLHTVSIIDQTLLPQQFKLVEVNSLEEMIVAIKTMQVRGAPLIGAAAAYGLALATKLGVSDEFLMQTGIRLISSRPTAVNLQWAVQRMLDKLLATPLSLRVESAWREAATICDEDILTNVAIGQNGLAVIKAYFKNCKSTSKDAFNILTHCNAGWLATVDGGTALAPIYAAHDAGIKIHVWVDETRPRNQGASLTAWELAQHGVPYTVICDNAGGHLMQKRLVNMVIVGADRVASNGDVCNKIGTYLKALAAFDNAVPFYVAAPLSTIDWTIPSGEYIEIETRNSDEVAWVRGQLVSGEIAQVNILPLGSHALNPAFDVTPARLVTGVISELGTCPPHQMHTFWKSS